MTSKKLHRANIEQHEPHKKNLEWRNRILLLPFLVFCSKVADNM